MGKLTFLVAVSTSETYLVPHHRRVWEPQHSPWPTVDAQFCPMEAEEGYQLSVNVTDTLHGQVPVEFRLLPCLPLNPPTPVRSER